MSNGSCLGRHDCWLTWEEEGDEDVAILNFSDDLVEQLGWEEGDELHWEDNNDGSFSLFKLQQDN